MSEERQSKILAAIERLYDQSPTGRDLLERAASANLLNIGYISGTAGRSTWFGTAPNEQGYIVIDPDMIVHAFNVYGASFIMDWAVIIGHELKHLVDHARDVVDSTTNRNNTYSQVNYDYFGDVLATEWQITKELFPDAPTVFDPATGTTQFDDITVITFDFSSVTLRATYQAALVDTDPRIAMLPHDGPLGFDYSTYEGVDIVRFGDVERGSGSLLLPDDHIDVAAQSNGRSYLILGFLGDDVIKTGDGDDIVYGGPGNDVIYSTGGNDTLYGNDDNDVIRLSGVSGFADGGAGDDLIVLAGPFNAASGGPGADIFRLESLWPGASYSISDPDADDTLVWHGYVLTGGTAVVVDFETFVSASGYPGFTYRYGQIDDHGVIYFWTGRDGLLIRFPDGSTATVLNFANGDLGLTFDAPVDYDVPIEARFDDDGVLHIGSSPHPFSTIALDGVWENLIDLPGAQAAIWGYGPASLDTSLFA